MDIFQNDDVILEKMGARNEFSKSISYDIKPILERRFARIMNTF